MAKKVKKKGKTPHKEKRVVTSSPKVVTKPSSQSVETVDNGFSVIKERNPCAHLDKAVDLVKLSERIGSSEPIRCQDCRDGPARGSKGKGKHGKNKGTAIWVCLHCGQFACGGVGFPTIVQSHAVRHARQSRHPIAIQFDNPQLCWCFKCNSLIPVQKSKENGDTLFNIVKLIKGRSVEGDSGDVEDVWFGGGSIKSEIMSEGPISSGITINVRDGYMVRGLINLGNTCFFNSIMQNLLGMDRLRDYFLKLEGFGGPLTVALKKLYAETSFEGGLRNVINPKSFFGCLCSKAPQFRGFQQHDSHELLRCLLDGLCTEELGVRKKSCSNENGVSPGQDPTFVDAIFGGRISSTVCCTECGHSSTVFEPFLDLSLPVPAKKPPSKKVQPVSRAQKTKALPKRAGSSRSKANKGANLVPARRVSKASESSHSSQQDQSSVPVTEDVVTSSGDSTWLDFINPTIMADNKVSVSRSQTATHELENKHASNNVLEGTSAELDDFTWFDYLEPDKFTDDSEASSKNKDMSGIQDSRNEDVDQDEVLMQNSSLSSGQVSLLSVNPNIKSNSSSRNSSEDEVSLQVQVSEVLLLPYKEESSNSAEKIEEGDSSSVAGQGQVSLDFDGFGDLFNEPEISAGPSTAPLSGNFQDNEVAESGFLAGNSSESADEVDNTDSPVSIDSCLAYFTKPELLSNEHGWHCDNCSKTLQRQKKKLKKNQGKTTSQIEMNGGAATSQTNLMDSKKKLSCGTQVGNFTNGSIKGDTVLNTSNDRFLLHDGKHGDSNQNCTESEINKSGELSSTAFQLKEAIGEMESAPPELLGSSCDRTCNQASSSDQASDSWSVNEPSSNKYNTCEVQQMDSELLAEESESEEGEDEELDSTRVKVRRDATKRFLIDKAPPILTIHLKRFSQDARGRLSKLNGHVDFREKIKLKPYMDARHEESDSYDYRLLGVVEHSGTMKRGHYVAYVRGGEKRREDGTCVWYHASDASVHEVSFEEVLRSEAYILFYEKI